MEITATFKSSCPACSRTIEVDDQIVLDEGWWVHKRCQGVEVPESRNPTCPECFIQHAGECA